MRLQVLTPTTLALGFALTALATMAPPSAAGGESALVLREGWALQSSKDVAAEAPAVSTAGFAASGWHNATVPATVVAALVADGTYPDPHFGKSVRAIPGTSYPVAENFSNLPMPEDSPFRVAWWYRTEFRPPAEARGKTTWLRLDGVNYRAEVWLNGQRVADAQQTAGAWRLHELDVTRAIRPGETNALAILVSPPQPDDLAITFVDWNPAPADKNMGLVRGVSLVTSGPVALRHPQVLTKVDLPSLAQAALTVKVVAQNTSARTVTGTLRARVDSLPIDLTLPVTLAAGERRELRLTPEAFPALVVKQPRLWWPARLGAQHLQTVDLELTIDGAVSDRASSRFGIRDIRTEKNERGDALFVVNGQRLLVRGAGWSSEMLMRSSPERLAAEIAYVKDMGLNTIRLEGKLEEELFYDLCDREGILVLAGWCCCDHWEKWEKWDEEDYTIAAASQRDQILRLRGRASLLGWMNGSDNPPPARAEKAYLAVLKELEWPNPVFSNATDKAAEVSGPTGVKMRGPYEWVPPIYWLADTKLGGAHGFATEIGPGPAVPPVESIKKMMPAENLWPIDEMWGFHCGGGPFRDLKVFTAALERRYGKARGLDDYARKAQAAAYESHRAMFEGFGQQKYVATGVIQWMLNNAWPSMIWHLYDFYLRPGGSYFGTKAANEPLHVQLAPDDRSVVVVNSLNRAFAALKVTGQVFDVEGRERWTQSAAVDVAADGVVKPFVVPAVAGISTTHFVRLTLVDGAGKTASRNFYWLSTRSDELDWEKSDWYVTPLKGAADFTGLETLAPATLTASVADLSDAGKGEGRVRVKLANSSTSIAFQVRLQVKRGPAGEEVLPVLWEDNYVSLAPGETREIEARFALADLGGARPVVAVEGWNVRAQVVN